MYSDLAVQLVAFRLSYDYFMYSLLTITDEHIKIDRSIDWLID